MIYVRLQGGLGNSLFQLAALYALALDNEDHLCILNKNKFLEERKNDKRHPSKHCEEWNFFLDRFLLANENEINPKLVTNVSFTYTNLSYNENYIYNGYFQSEKWFAHRKVDIKRVFAPNLKLRKELDKYDINDKVAIHVRRGDYVNNSSKHPVQSVEYYKKAMEHFHGNEFVFFSDDITWCKKEFGSNINFIKDKDHVELWLMSRAFGNIISNSSFSWWAAWLNHEDKKVIAPKKWFGPAKKENSKDIVPDRWIKI